MSESIKWYPGQKGKRKRWSSLVLAMAVVLWAAAVAGCGWGQRPEPPPDPQTSFENAMTLYNKKKYERAAEAFRKFKEEFPLNTYTPLAELRTADSLYYDKKYIEAISAYEEFKKLHPTHSEIPYVIFQLGMCHFKQMHTTDRDPAETEKAMEQFRYLIESFPQSPQVEEAQKNMEICRKQLAEHEYLIGDLYYRTQRYKAALLRFEALLQKFPDSGFDERLRMRIQECKKQVEKEEKNKPKKEMKEKAPAGSNEKKG